MTFRTVVLPLGFGLSAVLCVPAAAAEEDPAPRPPVRVYTNEDLDRVRPFRDETGVRSVPAVAPDDRPAPAEKRRGRGEAYWRREAARVRERVRAMEAQAAETRAEIAEQAEEASHFLSGRRRSAASLSGSGSSTRLRAKLASLERRIREMEQDLAERARRDSALPGWLRP
jgi:septal ring factor EnvC (AmiA/AmiB activator)